MLDDLAEEAPADVLQDVMLTIVFPLARHTWDKAAFGEEPMMKRRNHQDHPSSSSTRSAATATPPPPQNGRHRAERGSGGGYPSAAAQPEAAQEAPEAEDGFEMVEAPDESGHPHAGAAASAPTLSREPSGGRDGGDGNGEGAGTKDSDDDNIDGDNSDGEAEVGLQQLSSPALLALLLVLKSFLKHLSSLRRGEKFCDVWHEVGVVYSREVGGGLFVVARERTFGCSR